MKSNSKKIMSKLCDHSMFYLTSIPFSVTENSLIFFSKHHYILNLHETATFKAIPIHSRLLMLCFFTYTNTTYIFLKTARCNKWKKNIVTGFKIPKD